MDEKKPDETEAPFFATQTPFRKDLRRRLARLRERLNPRTLWWTFLDRLESSAAFRFKLYVTVAVLGSAVIGSAWYFPLWRENRAVRVARQWLDAGKLEQAEAAVNLALQVAADRPEAWDLAADFARAVRRPQGALTFSRQAAVLSPEDAARHLNRAGDALALNRLEEAETSLNMALGLAPASSARAERLAGEIARQRGDLTAAYRHFQAAIRIGGVRPESEIPLGLVLAASSTLAERPLGIALLEKWAGDAAWGVEALRPLLETAVAEQDAGRMQRWADALLAHPRRETNDILNSLLALSRVDPNRHAAALAAEQQAAGSDPVRVTELISWLAGMGRGAEAIRWARTLPATVTEAPPVAVALGDALRLAGDWPGLLELSGQGDWERLDFMRLAYQALAARQLGDNPRYTLLWQSLADAARRRGGQGAFLAGVVYSWGWKEEAVGLWEIAAEQPGLAAPALGALARHYQMQRDAEGLHRTFSKLNEIRSTEPTVVNNHAYLSALMGRVDRRAEAALRAFRAAEPDNLDYRSTAAFLLLQNDQPREALALLEPVAAPLGESSARAFTYGLVLAANGRRADARAVLAKVDRAKLTLREEQMLDAALNR